MVEERQWCGGWSHGGCGEGSGGIMARVAKQELVAGGVGGEEAERGWQKVLAVAETLRVGEREAVTREAVMERDGSGGVVGC